MFFFLSRDTVKTALKVNILFIHGTKGRTYCGGGGGWGGRRVLRVKIFGDKSLFTIILQIFPIW